MEKEIDLTDDVLKMMGEKGTTAETKLPKKTLGKKYPAAAGFTPEPPISSEQVKDLFRKDKRD